MSRSSYYTQLSNVGTHNAHGNAAQTTVIIPQYGGISYQTLQRAPASAMHHRSFATAYGSEENSECGRYYQNSASMSG